MVPIPWHRWIKSDMWNTYYLFLYTSSFGFSPNDRIRHFLLRCVFFITHHILMISPYLFLKIRFIVWNHWLTFHCMDAILIDMQIISHLLFLQKKKMLPWYVHLWLIHVDVWKKTTKFCKAIILQLKINKFKKCCHEYPCDILLNSCTKHP